MDDQLLPKIGGETACVTGRADKAWAVAHYYVARLMRAAVGGDKITPAIGFMGVEVCNTFGGLVQELPCPLYSMAYTLGGGPSSQSWHTKV